MTVISKIKVGGMTYDIAYPVGSIYLSVNDTSPAEIFGGTWEQLKDRFLLAAGDTYPAGSTGGEAQHTLTENEMPNHSHKLQLSQEGSSAQSNCVNAVRFSWTNQWVQGYGTTDNGGGAAHNNMPPYLAVYMWKRIA